MNNERDIQDVQALSEHFGFELPSRYQPCAVHIREINPADYHVLGDFLYNAIYVPPGAKLPPREIIFAPEIYIYG